MGCYAVRWCPASPGSAQEGAPQLMVMVLLAGSNCVLDPLVYYFSAEGFRNTLRGLSAPLRGKTLAAKGAQEASPNRLPRLPTPLL